MSAYPEHDKLDKIKELQGPIGAFLLWLEFTAKFQVCESEEKRGGTIIYHPVSKSTEEWLAAYLKLDLTKLHAETEAMKAELAKRE